MMAINLNAPAAKTYISIADGGKDYLDTYCQKYPMTDQSFLLPPVFVSEYTEGIDPVTKKIPRRPGLTKQEEDNVRGVEINLAGNETENTVYNVLSNLLSKTQKYPTITFNTFHCNVHKVTAIKNDYSLFPNVKELESDFLVIIKQLGFIFVEVKRDASAIAVTKGEKQLTNISQFIYNLINAYSGNSATMRSFADLTSIIPAAKVLVVPKELGISKKQNGCYHFYKDSLDDIENKWQNVICDLESQVAASSGRFKNLNDFHELASLVTGVWALKSIACTSSGYTTSDFDAGKACLAHRTKETDTMVDEARLTSDSVKGRTEVEMSNTPIHIEHNTPSSTFRSAAGINLYYLTPPQKYLFDQKKQCFVRSAGGTGKTLLTLTKIIELVPTITKNQKILLVAPFPHTIRCKNMLEANNITVYESAAFPPPPTHSCDVILMTQSDFFSKKFLKYNLVDYHFFLDDAHACIQQCAASRSGIRKLLSKRISVADIRTFFVQLHLNSLHDTDLYRWVLIDIMQDNEVKTKGSDMSKLCLKFFYDDDDQPVPSFEIVQLNHVLRNTREIGESECGIENMFRRK